MARSVPLPVLNAYHKLYADAQEVFDRHNPCEFKDGVCKLGRKGGCCDGCSHLGPNGCTTTNLDCKLFLCSERAFSQNYRELRAKGHETEETLTDCALELKILERQAEKARLLTNYYMSYDIILSYLEDRFNDRLRTRTAVRKRPKRST